MAIVVRLGPLPLQRRGPTRVAELERIFGTAVQLIEVFTVAELATAVETPDVIAVALDAPPPGQLAEAIAAVGALPKLRPLWRRQRNTRGEFGSSTWSPGPGSARTWPNASAEVTGSFVSGRLDQRSWENNEGEKRSKVEITANEIAPSLRWATVEITKNERRTPETVPAGGTGPDDEEPF